jgi:hypothetical protein
LPWHEVDAPDGWRLELFEDARGFFYPRRWRTSDDAAWIWWQRAIEDVSDGLQNYGFQSAQDALQYAYRERLERERSKAGERSSLAT